MSTFDSLGLPEPIVTALNRQGFNNPFPIQESAIPAALAGRDLQGRAPTGSGKTLAFGLPMLSLVGRADPRRPRALVLAPTRELAEQIRLDLAPFASSAGRQVTAIFGGVGYGPQRKALNRGVDVLVATPGRLEDLIEQGSVDLRNANIVVLDEADRMADMGFLPAVRRILDQTSPDRQTLLFSATLDGDVASLSRDYQTNPAKLQAEAVDSEELDIDHHFWRMDRTERVAQTAQVIGRAGRTIVFTRTRHGADRLVRQLSRSGVSAVSMHGGRSQNQRTRALNAFSKGRVQALVATDVAARGIHVEDVDLVVHFDMAGDHKDYLHRSGRTGRAGAVGTVLSLVVDGQTKDVKGIQRALKLEQGIDSPNIDRLFARRSPSDTTAPGRSAPPKHHSRPANAEQGSRSIFVGNLAWKTTASSLASAFARHGTVEKATISTRGGTNRSKGFGFVEMPASQSDAAIAALNGSTLDGRTLKVRVAR